MVGVPANPHGPGRLPLTRLRGGDGVAVAVGAGVGAVDQLNRAHPVGNVAADNDPRVRRPVEDRAASGIGISTIVLQALFIFGDLEHLVFESELYGSCPESRGTAVRK